MSFNALNIDFYLCGGIHSKGYAPGEQTTALLQELTMEGALYWNGAAYRENSLRYVLPEYLCDIYSAEQAMRLAKADLLSKYAIDASTPDDRSIAGEEMDGYEQITWISLLFPAGVLQSA